MTPPSSVITPSSFPHAAGRPVAVGKLRGLPWGHRLPQFLRDAFASLMRLCRTRVGVCAALALNACWIPYLGLEHDASLYALQVSQRAFDGLFANDLFLQFGSQDSLSAFSIVMAPFVRVIGVEAAFFVTFMLAQTAS